MEFRPATSKWLYASKKAADSQRFIYHASPSPSPEPTTPIEEGEGTRVDETTPVEDEHSDRASRTSRRRRNGESEETIERSASVSLLQQHVSYKSAPERPPLLDVTNIDLDRYVPGPLTESTSKIDPHSVRTDTVQPIGSSFLQTTGDGQDVRKEMQPPVDINLCELIPPPALASHSLLGTPILSKSVAECPAWPHQ